MSWRGGKWRLKSMLSTLYLVRALAVLAFVLAPKTEAVVLVFAAVMGLTFRSTVPPTVGLVAKFFGSANLATLFGMVMVTHQIGGFLGPWLGGKVFEATSAYVALAVGAALLHLPIREARVPQPVRAAA